MKCARWSMYADFLVLNLDRANFGYGCDVRQAAAIKLMN